MVTRGAYFDDDEQSFRRYSSRGHGYPLSHDRELHPTPHHGPYARQHISSHNPQNRSSPEQDTNAQPRRRIPVACGRCRKRKIRCSGDPGNGQPCSNCKSAGNETCQFLRVSSTEAQMKSDAAEFGYDSAAAVSRIQCRISPYGPQHQPYTPTHVTPLGADGYPQYRHNSLSAYQMPTKYFYPASYGDFGDENTDYGMPASSYSFMNQEPMTIPYSGAGSTRAWSQPQIPKSNSLFMEQDSSYSHAQLPYTYSIRPNISPESKGLSMSGISASLPGTINGNDRVLPYPAPAPSRPAQVGPTYLRSTDIIPPMTQPSVHFSNHGLMHNNMVNAVKALNAGASSENSSISSTYLPLSTSPDSIPSSQVSFATNSISSRQQNHESYTPAHETQQHSLYQHPDDSSENLSYGPSSSGSNRPSISSQANAEDSQPLSTNNSGGSLVDGRTYFPLASTQASYAPPPMIPVDMHSAAPIISRQSVSASS